ncbi:hypothetical protein [Streptomyces litchfieldiae]|uniref:Transposase n=1 Tax=Streptomyces litchfieldiae TaxID=3075543 RepID=A0ABU2MJ06_9ACTN|nr:hypothetical protein [Streptomyces sp. DSM 44938]MDT0341582.1 hypothetical protein [Streptomyces sp. DSM 44938]
MSWSGHWHGYGPWIGTRDSYGAENLRRPGTSPNDEQTRVFLSQTLPPMQLGHWLMRRDQTAADRTWTEVTGAVNWLRESYDANPPMERDDGRQAYVDLDTKTRYAADSLPRGVDVSWVHYMRSQNLVSFSVVCCPHRFHPRTPCPLPPG